ncbi:hypothetical protein L4C34_03550 [Vibrio profundum]|uniref:hypothetical protein n=1 Tax=Vibrio profundum TaxID=2910247 RepID=UPI003D131820
MDDTLNQIIGYLNENGIRATYGAVADVLGVNAQSVGMLLGERRPEVSWVVNRKTGMPTGYLIEECAYNLLSRQEIIKDAYTLKYNVGL